MDDIKRFKEGGKNLTHFVTKTIMWSPLIALVIYIIYLMVGLMTSKDMSFTEAIAYFSKEVFQKLYFLLRPVLFILSKLAIVAEYIFGDAWNSENRIRSIVFTLASTIVLCGIAVAVYPSLAGDVSGAQQKLMMTWYGRIFISLAAILALMLLFVFIKTFNLDQHKKSKRSFPSDKSFKEQSNYLFDSSKTYLTLLIGIAIFLGILAFILWYMFSDRGDAYTGSYMLLIASSVVLLAMIHTFFSRSGLYKSIMKNSVVQIIYHSIFLLPCIFLDIIEYLSKEFQHTPRSVYIVLGIEIVFIFLYLLLPIIKNYLYTISHDSFGDDVIDKEITALKQESIEITSKIKELKVIDNLGPNGTSYLSISPGFWRKMLLSQGDEDKSKKIIKNTLKNFNIDLTKNKKKVNKIYTKFKINYPKIIKLKEDKMLIADKIKTLESQLGNDIGKLKSVLLLNEPSQINENMMIGDRFNMRTYGEKDLGEGNYPPNYNYALSFWVYLNSDGPNYNSNSFKKIIDYSDKPRVSYNPIRNEIAITIKKHKGEIKQFLLKNMKLQKWINLVINYDGGILDIFRDGELVVSSPGEIPYMKNDVITIGENNGVNGGICNVVYYNTHISKARIQTNYNLLKNNNPPVV